MNEEKRSQYRDFLKDRIRMEIDFSQTPQSLGEAPPPIQKPDRGDGRRTILPRRAVWTGIAAMDLQTAIAERESHRRFLPEPLSLTELAFLLWATQGIRRQPDSGSALRTVPSAGCRHAFETYLAVTVAGELAPGIYRYLPQEQQLVQEQAREDLPAALTAGTHGQSFVGRAPVTFIWTAVPYRMEWRYDLAAHKVIAIDVGHVCQNLYLAAAAVGAGTCAVAAYNQELMDDLVGVDGDDEFVIYLAPVGRI